MRFLYFSKRVFKEIILDPLSIIFGLGFPIVLLFLLSAIQSNIPVSMFEIDSLTPGIAVFSLSFITLFSALLVSKDRGSLFLQRLFTTEMKPVDFIFGYTLPLIPLAILQMFVCFAFAVVLGLEISLGILFSILLLIPCAMFYISLGLLFGSILSDKAVGGICGALLTNLSAWLSGTWFDMSLVGGWFEKLANVLPFVHAVELGRCALRFDFASALPHLLWVLSYMLVITVIAIAVFKRKMKQ